MGFSGQIPTFLFAPFAGVWVDRLDRRQVLVVTQILAMLQSLALAVLTLGRHINIQEIIWLSAFQGLINAFDMPARQAFLVQMVEDKQDLGNAIALNSSMVNLARLVGPSLAGAVIAVSGEGSCFLIDGISYIAVIASLLAMRLHARGSESYNRLDARSVERRLGIRLRLRAGAHDSVVVRDRQPDGLAIYRAHADFCRENFEGRSAHLGFLMGAVGIGALVSAISLALRKTVLGLGRMIPISTALPGCGSDLFGMSRVLWLSLLLMLLCGFGMMQQMAASNTIIQTIVEDDKRGRVMSFYAMAFVGMAPFGSLLAGVWLMPSARPSR